MPALRDRIHRGLPLEPCLPRPAEEPLAGPNWIHEIKHDGFRILARRDAKGVRLYTRNGYNFADRFPRIVEATAGLPVQSCFIDGEAIVFDERGLSAFDRLSYRQHDRAAVLEYLGEFVEVHFLHGRKRIGAQGEKGEGTAFGRILAPNCRLTEAPGRCQRL
jgi:ATP-dependent DNA ligase